jgi:hypothetical protein
MAFRIERLWKSESFPVPHSEFLYLSPSNQANIATENRNQHLPLHKKKKKKKKGEKERQKQKISFLATKVGFPLTDMF